MPDPVNALRGLESYAIPALDLPTDLRLDGNEGAAPPAWVLEALVAAGPEVLRCYPDARATREAIAERFGLPASELLVTAGADEALDRVCRAFLEPGRRILLPRPGFEMLEKYARLAGAAVDAYDWLDGGLPVEAIRDKLAPATAVVAVVSPNNPTGLAASAGELRAVARAAPQALCLVDLAYGEFADSDLTPVARELGQTILVRSLSKSWGIAGLRVGFAWARAPQLAALRVAGSPYSVAAPSLVLARAWLERGADHVCREVAAIRARRVALASSLARLAERVWPSQANFVLARFADAARVQRRLAEHGIAVRRFPERPLLEGCLRITVPPTDESMQRLTRALGTIGEVRA